MPQFPEELYKILLQAQINRQNRPAQQMQEFGQLGTNLSNLKQIALDNQRKQEQEKLIQDYVTQGKLEPSQATSPVSNITYKEVPKGRSILVNPTTQKYYYNGTEIPANQIDTKNDKLTIMPGTSSEGGRVILVDTINRKLLNMFTGEEVKDKQSGDKFINSSAFANISPEDQKIIANALANGQVQPQDIRTPVQAKTMAQALKVNPQATSYLGDVKESVAKAFSIQKQGLNITSLNTALGHAGDALKAYEKVNNLGTEFANKPYNYIKSHTNDPDIIALDINLAALAGELATLFKGTAGTDEENKLFLNQLKDTLTPEQWRGALQKVGELVKSRLSALEFQRDFAMGGGTGSMVSPHAQEAFNAIVPSTGTATGGNKIDTNKWEIIP